MFDPITAELISKSPQLSQLDLEGLPKRLTEAFADIVSARIRMRSASSDDASEMLARTLLEVRRLAAANESYVSLLPNRENRAAAAFVAASSHQVYMLGNSIAGGRASYIDGSSLSSDICASLLFLIAEAHADAAECSKHITTSESQSKVEQALLTGIQYLCTGRLSALIRIPLPVISSDIDSTDQAVEALYLELFKGVQHMAARLLARVDVSAEEGGIEAPSAFFERVKKLSVSALGDVLGAGEAVISIFSGPLHLSNLLLATEPDLMESALTRIPAPRGVAEEGWWQIVRRMARRRPYLWRNHRQAIAEGYLEQGISAAISFPTGGGKSTLSELKIATTLLLGKKVVFLVPTNALVNQTARALKDTFQDFNVVGEVEDDVVIDDSFTLPEAIVTTPERCIMLMTAQPDAFTDLGLIVFDECHLLHPRDVEKSRRSVDAMLAVLNLTLIAPEADMLMLSAMMKNAEEIALWIQDLTGRPCRALNLAWKPTRQVRGSVVYPTARINDLNSVLQKARQEFPERDKPPIHIRRELHAQPFGFFSLLQTWATQDREDYTLLPLLGDEYPLSVGKGKRGRWYLTPNGNQTSAAIAAAAAATRLKTLVFVQSIVLAEASVRDFPSIAGRSTVVLTDEEKEYYRLASEEMGGAEYCYLSLQEDGAFAGNAAGHHALLLEEERYLHESLYKRPNGIDVLFATSTVAQGMNFPSQLVIISGDSRFDEGADKMAQLEAHELLNAAGRAGRAGENSQGMVLVVPSKVVEFDNEANIIGNHWVTLQSIFSQSDQCLNIDDPLTALLDKIQEGTAETGMPAYLVGRLPPVNEEEGDGPIRTLITRSFGSFRARQIGNVEWVESRISAAVEARSKLATTKDEDWLDRAAGLTGISVDTLREVTGLFVEGYETKTSLELISMLMNWLHDYPIKLFEILRPENIAGLFGTKFDKLPSEEEKASRALPVINEMLRLWLSGVSLKEIETAYPDGGDRKRCEYSRHFVLKLVPDLAFFAGLPARLLTGRNAKSELDIPLPVVLTTLGTVVREGCDSPESLAIRLLEGRTQSRVAARARYESIKKFFRSSTPTETFEDVMNRAREAVLLATFNEL